MRVMHQCMAKDAPADPVELPRWDDLALLLAVTRAGSFTSAARQLGIEQSTVSRRIQNLEDALGITLFERRSNRSVLTPVGERLLRRAEAVEAEIQAFTDEVRGTEREVRGRVRLALTESIAAYGVLPQVLPLLRKKHPQLSLELLTSYGVADLGHREAEIALRFFRPRSGDLVASRIVTMQTAWLAHRCFYGRPIDELDFMSVRLEGVETPEETFLDKHIGKKPWLVTSSYLAQIEAVRAGLGVALVPRSLKRIDPNLVELDLGTPPGPVLELWLVAPSSLRKVPRIAAVWSLLEEELRILEG